MGTNFFDTIKHFKNYLSARVAAKALGVISLPVLTRLLTPDDYGVISVFFACIGIFKIVLTLNVGSVIGRYFYEKKDDFNDFFSTSIIFTILIFLLSSCFVYLFKSEIADIFSLRSNLIVFILIYVSLGIVSSSFQQTYLPQRESGLIAKTSILESYSGFILVVIIILILDDEKYYGPVIGRMITASIIAIYFIYKLKPYFLITFKKKHIKYMLKYSVPLMPYALSGIILAQFDRIMISRYIGEYSTGLYSLAYAIGGLLSMIISALLAAWTPDYFENMNNKFYDKLDNDIKKLFCIITFFSLGLILFGRELGLILADKKFHVALKLVPIIAYGHIFIFLWQIYGRSIGFSYKTFYISLIAIFSGGLNILLNALFIPILGYEAGAYTTVVSYFFMAFLAWIVVKYILQVHCTPLKFILKPLLTVSLITLIIVLMHNFIDYSFIFFGLKAVIFLFATYFIMKEYWVDIWEFKDKFFRMK